MMDPSYIILHASLLNLKPGFKGVQGKILPLGELYLVGITPAIVTSLGLYISK